MSIVGMRKFMQSWFHYLLFGLAIIFAVGWVGISLGTGKLQDNEETQGGIIAKVNGQKLTRADFEKQFDRQMEQIQGELPSPFEASQIRGTLFDNMIELTLQTQAAEKEGLKASRRDVREKIDEIVDGEVKNLKGQLLAGRKDKKTDDLLDAELRKRGTSLNAVKSEVRKAIDSESVRRQILVEKLADVLKKRVDVSDKAVRASFDEVRLSQITIGTEKRSEVQAEQRAKEITEKLRDGADFATLARQYSEDFYKDRGGDQGYFIRRAWIEPELAKAVSKLKTGEVSDRIKTPRGFVIVKVSGQRSALPKDYDNPKKKKEYRDAYIAMETSRLQREYFEKLRKNAKIEALDPELKGYMLLREMFTSYSPSTKPAALKAKAEQVIKQFNRAAEATSIPDVMARAYSQVAYMYERMRSPGMFGATKEEQARYRAGEKKALLNALANSESNDLRFMLANIYIEESKHNDALESLEYVSENAYDDFQTHSQLLQMYQRVEGSEKVASLIAQERKWLAEHKDQASPAPGQFTVPP